MMFVIYGHHRVTTMTPITSKFGELSVLDCDGVKPERYDKHRETSDEDTAHIFIYTLRSPRQLEPRCHVINVGK